MKMISARKLGLTCCLLVAALLTGCASAVRSPINEADKDPNGTFDGKWTANVQKSPATQYLQGNWRFNCNGKAWNFAIDVDDSVGRINYKQTKHFAFVDRAGRFRFEIPMDNPTSASGTSDASINRGDRTMIVNGSLKSSSGRITFGIAEFANQGCTAKIDYSK